MLGAFGDSAKTGKPVGDDLREGKPTVMLALAREAASASQCSVLDRVGPSATDADVAAIQQVMIDTGAVGKIEEEIERLLDEALQAIDALPNANGSRAALRALADFVVDRDT